MQHLPQTWNNAHRDHKEITTNSKKTEEKDENKPEGICRSPPNRHGRKNRKTTSGQIGTAVQCTLLLGMSHLAAPSFQRVCLAPGEKNCFTVLETEEVCWNLTELKCDRTREIWRDMSEFISRNPVRSKSAIHDEPSPGHLKRNKSKFEKAKNLKPVLLRAGRGRSIFTLASKKMFPNL